MEVVELVLLPARLRENIDRRQSGFHIWHVIVEERRVGYGLRPDSSVGDVGSVDCGVEHHCSGDRHDRSNRALGVPVVMVCADTSKSNNLLK